MPFIFSDMPKGITVWITLWNDHTEKTGREETNHCLFSSFTLSSLLSHSHLSLWFHWYIHPSLTSPHYLSPLYDSSLHPSLQSPCNPIVPSNHLSLCFVLSLPSLCCTCDGWAHFFVYFARWDENCTVNSSKLLTKNKICKVTQHFCQLDNWHSFLVDALHPSFYRSIYVISSCCPLTDTVCPEAVVVTGRPRPCGKTEFTCSNQRCIPIQLQCDLFSDCGDGGSDEQDCKACKCSISWLEQTDQRIIWKR